MACVCLGSFAGWRVQNDGKMLMQAVGKCESCSNYDFSYNGLGDREAVALGLALQKNYRSVCARAAPSRCWVLAQSAVCGLTF